MILVAQSDVGCISERGCLCDIEHGSSRLVKEILDIHRVCIWSWKVEARKFVSSLLACSRVTAVGRYTIGNHINSQVLVNPVTKLSWESDHSVRSPIILICGRVSQHDLESVVGRYLTSEVKDVLMPQRDSASCA
jgi:hypothetical protein